MQQNAICTNICHPRNKTEVKQFHNNKDREGEPKKKACSEKFEAASK